MTVVEQHALRYFGFLRLRTVGFAVGVEIGHRGEAAVPVPGDERSPQNGRQFMGRLQAELPTHWPETLRANGRFGAMVETDPEKIQQRGALADRVKLSYFGEPTLTGKYATRSDRYRLLTSLRDEEANGNRRAFQEPRFR